MMNGNKRLVFGILAAAGAMVLWGCDDSGNLTVQMRAATVASGETVAPSGIERVIVTISEVTAHFVPHGGAKGKNGEKPSWTTLSSGEATYDLMTLKDDPAVLGYGNLGDGKVTQVRLVVSESTPPVVTVDGVDHQMKVPSGTIKLVSPFCVSSTADTVITLDFDPEKSIVATADGYELRPTIKVNGEGGSCKDGDDDDDDDEIEEDEADE